MSEASDHPQPPRCEGALIGQATIDPAQVAALYAEYGAELRRFVLGVVRDHDVAGDVLQGTFARAVERGHTARTETIKGWLFQVALREALTAGGASRPASKRAGGLRHSGSSAASVRRKG